MDDNRYRIYDTHEKRLLDLWVCVTLSHQFKVIGWIEDSTGAVVSRIVEARSTLISPEAAVPMVTSMLAHYIANPRRHYPTKEAFKDELYRRIVGDHPGRPDPLALRLVAHDTWKPYPQRPRVDGYGYPLERHFIRPGRDRRSDPKEVG